MIKQGTIGAIFALLFLWSSLAQATVLAMAGAETGDLREFTSSGGNISAVTTPVQQSGYSVSLGSASAAGTAFTTLSMTATTTVFIRFNLWIDSVSNSVALADHWQIFRVRNSTEATIDISSDSSGNASLNLWDSITAAQVGSPAAISKQAWHTIELKVTSSATVGVLELKIDGSVVATGSGLNTGGTNVNSIGLTGIQTVGSADRVLIYEDDLIVNNTGYPGIGYNIARQGAAGTPTYTAWTCTALASNWQDWSETPFSATNNCSSTSTIGATAQSMFMGLFNVAGNAQEGSGLIFSPYTINAARTELVGKVGATATANSIATRRRVGGANTDTNCTNNTADTFCADTIWSPSFTNLSDGTTEIGAVDNNLVPAQTAQVEDVWEMVDFQPTATTTATPTSTPTPTTTPTATGIPTGPTPTATATPSCFSNYNIHLVDSTGHVMNGGASAVSGNANTDIQAISTASKIIDAFTGSASATVTTSKATARIVGRGGNVCSGTDSAVTGTYKTTLRVCTSDHQIAACTEGATAASYSASVSIIDATGKIDDTF